MNPYYLIAQLPSLDAVGENTPLPITEERFSELATRLLSRREAAVLARLTLCPARESEPTGNALVDAWERGERALRLALEAERTPGQKSEGREVTAAVTAARAACAMRDPMEAERLLADYRAALLETLRPTDPFSTSMVYYYGLKLKLLTRSRGFDVARGEREYRKLYDSILRGEKQETEE